MNAKNTWKNSKKIITFITILFLTKYGEFFLFSPMKNICCMKFGRVSKNSGFIKARLCKFKDFSRISQRLSYCFQGLKTKEKYLFTRQNSTSEILESITKDNKYKIKAPQFILIEVSKNTVESSCKW